jgi:hypothetical protein
MSHRGRHPKRDPQFPPQLILLQETCAACAKTSYPSRHAASSQIKRLDRDNRRRGTLNSGMHVYECPHGNGWHLAHRLSQGQRTRTIPKPHEGLSYQLLSETA